MQSEIQTKENYTVNQLDSSTNKLQGEKKNQREGGWKGDLQTKSNLDTSQLLVWTLFGSCYKTYCKK